jgi:hypothetical protein
LPRAPTARAAGHTGTWPAHEEGICSLAWSPDGSLIASGGNGGDVRLWEWDGDSLRPSAVLEGHSGSVRGLAWSPTGRHLLSGAEDGHVVVWSVLGGSPLARHGRHDGFVNAVAWAPDGAWYASAGRDGFLVVYDAHDHDPIARLESPLGSFTSLSCSRTNGLLAASARTSVISLWLTVDWSLRGRFGAGTGTVWTVAWAADGRLVSGGEDGVLRAWDARSGRCTLAVEAHSDTVARVAASLRASLVVTLGHDETVAAWSLAGGRFLGRAGGAYPGWVGCLDLHPLGTVVASPDGAGRSIRIVPVGEIRGEGCETAVAHVRRVVAAARSHRQLVADPDELARAGGSRRFLRCAGLRLEERGEALELARTETLFVELERLDRLESGLAPYGLRIALWLLPDEFLRASFRALCGFDRSLVETALAHRVISRRRGWATREPGGLMLHLPGGRAPATQPWGPVEPVARWLVEEPQPGLARTLFAQLVATTLFRAFALTADRLALRDDDGTEWVVSRRPTGRSATAAIELAVLGGGRRPVARDVVARLVERLLRDLHPQAEPPAAAQPGRPKAPEWQACDETACGTWPLGIDEVGDAEAGLGSLLERIDDECARQLRLLTLPARRRLERHDVVILHAVDDGHRASRVRAELEDMGLLAWIDDGGDDAVPLAGHPERAERAGVVAVLLGRSAGCDWREQTFYPAYDELVGRRRRGGPRLRWLPLVLPEAPPKPRLPTFLRGFDALSWHDEPKSARRRSLVELTAAVLVDRARL